MKKHFILPKRIISLALAVFMILSTFPFGMYSYGEEIDEKKIYTAEELLEHGSRFYNITKKNDSDWVPISLTAFTLKATGISQPTMSDDGSVYKYLEGSYQRVTNNSGGVKNYSILGLIDKIYDQIAMGLPYDEIKPDVIELLSKQSSTGKFSANAAEHAKAILVLDAYYGLDYGEEWDDCIAGEGKGRLNAIRVLVKSNNTTTITALGDEGFWNYPNNKKFLGAYLEPGATQETLRPYGFSSLSTLMPTSFLPAIALSNYAEHPEVGNDISDIISNLLVQMEKTGIHIILVPIGKMLYILYQH